MRKKTLVTILLTIILFLSDCGLTVATVYRVSAVTLQMSVVSEEAKIEAENLEKAVALRYKKQNIFFVDKKEAQEEFEKYPHLRLTGFEKSYPNRLIVKGTEDPEVYALEKEGGYYVLGADGTILGERASATNRSDGKDNVVISGVSVQGEKGKIPTDEDFLSVIAFCKTFDETAGGIRANILSVKLEKPTSSEQYAYLLLQTREGVKIRVSVPKRKPQEKAKSLAEFYLNAETTSRLSGTIYVSDEGKCSYERE